MRKKLKNKLTVDRGQLTMIGSELLSIVHYTLFVLLVLMFSCTPKDGEHEHADTYTCPMHPTVISDKPGVCPVCAMDLVRKGRPGEEVKITEDLAKLMKSPNEVVVADVETIKPAFKSMPVTWNVQGSVTYDQRQIFTITSHVEGRLEKVFLKYRYQPVRAGQYVAEIYSAEIASAQREFLYLLKHDPNNQVALNGAWHKLIAMGVPEMQMEAFLKKREVSPTVSIHSPYTGFVITDEVLTSSSSGEVSIKRTGGMGMNGGSGNSISTLPVGGNTTATSMVREGGYVSPGQPLFRVVNTSSLWIEFNLPPSQAAQINEGDHLQWNDRQTIKQLRVDFIEPFFVDGEDFIKLRSYYKGGDVSVGQLIDATITNASHESLWIPKSALIDLGLNHIAFVNERGLFKPRKINIGLRSGEWIEIITGLTSSDQVAMNAQYLMDSENFIKTSN